MTNLYELSSNFMEVQALIEEGNEGLRDTLDAIDLAIEDKLENIAKLIRNLDGEATALKNEEERLADKRKSIENNIKNLKQYSQSALEDTGNRKLKAGIFTYSIQKNPPSVAINDDKLIPQEYYVPVEPKLDKQYIKEMLKDGEEVPGAELSQGDSVRIR